MFPPPQDPKSPKEEVSDDSKPPYSYVALISMAIKESTERRLLVRQILENK